MEPVREVWIGMKPSGVGTVDVAVTDVILVSTIVAVLSDSDFCQQALVTPWIFPPTIAESIQRESEKALLE